MLEAKFEEQGAIYEKGDDWSPKVCADGKLVTGQYPQPSDLCAKPVAKLFGYGLGLITSTSTRVELFAPFQFVARSRSWPIHEYRVYMLSPVCNDEP